MHVEPCVIHRPSQDRGHHEKYTSVAVKEVRCGHDILST